MLNLMLFQDIKNAINTFMVAFEEEIEDENRTISGNFFNNY